MLGGAVGSYFIMLFSHENQIALACLLMGYALVALVLSQYLTTLVRVKKGLYEK
jgi:hypothetical protein